LENTGTPFKVVSVDVDKENMVAVGDSGVVSSTTAVSTASTTTAASTTTTVSTASTTEDPSAAQNPLVQWFYNTTTGACQAEGIAQLANGETTLFDGTGSIDESRFVNFCTDAVYDMLRTKEEMVKASLLPYVQQTRTNILPPKDQSTPLHRNPVLESTDFMKKKKKHKGKGVLGVLGVVLCVFMFLCSDSFSF